MILKLNKTVEGPKCMREVDADIVKAGRWAVILSRA